MAETQRVLGAGVLARLRANEQIVGRAAYDSALRAVPAELRTEVEGLTPLAWIDLDRVELVQDAIATAAGRDAEELHDEAIRRAQEQTFRTLYRLALRLASDEWLVSRTAAMFRRTRAIGSLASSMPEPGRADLVLSEWPGIRDRYARQVAIGIETLLTLTDRRDVKVRYDLEPDGARFVVTWLAVSR
jgi:hypothetical protein